MLVIAPLMRSCVELSAGTWQLLRPVLAKHATGPTRPHPSHVAPSLAPLPSPHSHGSGPSVSAALSASAEERWALRLHKAERALEVERRVSEELRQQLAAAQEAAARGRAAMQRMEQVTDAGVACVRAVGTGQLARAGDDCMTQGRTRRRELELVAGRKAGGEEWGWICSDQGWHGL